MSKRRLRRLRRPVAIASAAAGVALMTPSLAAACGDGEYPANPNGPSGIQSGISVNGVGSNCGGNPPHWKVYSNGALVALRFENTSGTYYSNARNQNVRTCTFSAGPSDPYLHWVTWNCTSSNHSDWVLKLRGGVGSYAPNWFFDGCSEQTMLIEQDSSTYHLHLHFADGADAPCPPDKLWSGRMTVYAK